MNPIRLTLPAALALACAAPMFAQGTSQGVLDNLDARFKFRVAGQAASLQDKLDGRVFGMGFEVGYTHPLGRFSAELGYMYKSGQEYRDDVTAMATASGKKIDPRYSADARKNSLDGTTLRLGYERDPKAEWTWGAGLQLNFSRFKHQYAGTVSDGYSSQNDPIHDSAGNRPADAMSATYMDTYNGTPTKSALGVSPYAGFHYRIDESSGLECNVLLLNYTSTNYVHVAGTVADTTGGHTDRDSLATKSRFTPHIEFAYVFRF
ncbi:hypothetical protein [Geothrix sp. PMB-07]|uniref:hypothetical protein n=1 Tax=Geothrix sp. PMB-07 TaxID=3068640 RepID=UPI00274044E4|nr:hypothetical protein [Geothrix sp. PMB-07]WLT30432.1 hypothetical protein Q9293_11960 [Geothrix sp. PMB-07]